MTARVVLGRLKRGDDKTFRDINVTVESVAQDLTEEGWSVAAQLRTKADAATATDLTVNADPVLLAAGTVSLSLTRAVTATLKVGTHVCDVQVTGPGGRQSSDTVDVIVEADITRGV